MRENCGGNAGETAVENAGEMREKKSEKMREKLRKKCRRKCGESYDRTLHIRTRLNCYEQPLDKFEKVQTPESVFSSAFDDAHVWER